jgi:hypothetical protein
MTAGTRTKPPTPPRLKRCLCRHDDWPVCLPCQR